MTRAVMRMRNDFVRHVLLLWKELLQANDTGEKQSDFGQQQGFADEKGKTLECQTTDETYL